MAISPGSTQDIPAPCTTWHSVSSENYGHTGMGTAVQQDDNISEFMQAFVLNRSTQPLKCLKVRVCTHCAVQ